MCWRVGIWVVVCVGILVFVPDRASATSCDGFGAQRTLEQRIAEADVVFTGRIRSVNELPPNQPFWTLPRHLPIVGTLVFDVLSVEKGDYEGFELQERLIVGLIRDENYSPIGDFRVGDHWQIFAVREPHNNSLRFAMQCSSSHQVFRSTRVYVSGCNAYRGAPKGPGFGSALVLAAALCWCRRSRNRRWAQTRMNR